MTKTLVHQQLEALRWRMKLSDQMVFYLQKLKRGYEGELEFIELVEKYLSNQCVAINDFTFSVEGSVKQIDTLLIFNDEVIVFEVKNYKNEYVFKNNDIYTYEKNEKTRSPIYQLNETTRVLNYLFKKINCRLPIRKHIVFIGEDFHLFNAPVSDEIIMRGQLHKFLRNVSYKNQLPNQYSYDLREKLLAYEYREERRVNIDYTFDSLRKSVFCSNDGGELVLNNRTHYRCPECGETSSIEEVVLRETNNFKVLFPEEKISVPKLYAFTGGKISRHNLRKTLFKHYERTGKKRATHYLVT